jgi:hypothetical protein
MAPSKDLPGPVVELITALARGRCIPGTNRYARVCRQWQAAGTSSDEAQPLLQLYLDQRWLYPPDISKWMSMHGHRVGTLVIEASLASAQQLRLLLCPAAALSNLSRLEVAQRDSLARLAPVLKHLPQLQHLAAHVELTERHEWHGGSSEPLFSTATGVAAGSFCVGDRYLKALPALGRLCPQLVHLRLTLERQHHEYRPPPLVYMDDRLEQLLPEGLQQLTLSDTYAELRRPCSVWLHPHSLRLAHHPALQRLVLHGVSLPKDGVRYFYQGHELSEEGGGLEMVEGQEPEVHEQSPLQLSVRMSHGFWEAPLAEEATFVQLGPLLTDLQASSLPRDMPMSHIAPVTRLALSDGLSHHKAADLAALTGLRELELGEFSDLGDVMEQAASMPALCSLSVEGSISNPAAASSSLGRCTQLTSLGLLVHLPGAQPDGSEWSDEFEDSDDRDMQQHRDAGHWALAVQQLTGLRSLTIPPELLVHEAGAWLAPLTTLTRLCVQLPDFFPQQPYHVGRDDVARPEGAWLGQRNEAEARIVLRQVQVWPASLQCVVFWVAPLEFNWRHTMICPKHWEHRVAGRAQGPLQVWLELPGSGARGWPRPFQPCLGLSGVWELQAAAQGS